MAKKGNRVQVILECTEHKNSGQPGTSRYITVKNKKNNPERLELKKFNPILKKVMAKAAKTAIKKDPKQAAEAKNYTRVIKAVRSPKSGAYTFKEQMVHKDKVKEFLAQK